MEYEYMSIESCCASMAVLGKQRVRGPIDNMRSEHGLSDFLHVLNGDLYNIIDKKLYLAKDHLSSAGNIRNDFDYYRNVHFDINDEQNRLIIVGEKAVKNKDAFLVTNVDYNLIPDDMIYITLDDVGKCLSSKPAMINSLVDSLADGSYIKPKGKVLQKEFTLW